MKLCLLRSRITNGSQPLQIYPGIFIERKMFGRGKQMKCQFLMFRRVIDACQTASIAGGQRGEANGEHMAKSQRSGHMVFFKTIVKSGL